MTHFFSNALLYVMTRFVIHTGTCHLFIYLSASDVRTYSNYCSLVNVTPPACNAWFKTDAYLFWHHYEGIYKISHVSYPLSYAPLMLTSLLYSKFKSYLYENLYLNTESTKLILKMIINITWQFYNYYTRLFLYTLS